MSASHPAAAVALPATDALASGQGGRKNLVGLSRDELEAEMLSVGLEKFRARQLWHWIYHRGATDFAVMTTLAKPVRERLAESYVVARPTVVRDLR